MRRVRRLNAAQTLSGVLLVGQVIKGCTRMSWENRGNRRYYYRRRKVGGKVVSEYLGRGYSAELMQMLDEHERQERQDRRQAWQAIKDDEERLDAQLDEVTKAVNAYAGAVLLVNGYRQHKRGKWRKKRE